MRLRKRDPNALDAPMSPAELAAARATLGRTPAQFADDVQVTLYELEEMETGRRKIPELVAVLARSHVADHRTQEVMQASGLPTCAEGERLVDVADGALGMLNDAEDGDARDEAEARVRTASDALDAHMRSCPTCTARRDFLARHGPRVPELSEGPFLRFMGWVLTLSQRLPNPLRPPDGTRGDGRRLGTGMAAMLASFAFLPLLVASVFAFFRRAPLSALGDLATSVVFLVGYVATGYLAGAMWDALWPLRGRFAGYVLRGAMVMGTVFACIGVQMAALPGGVPLSATPVIVGITSPMGALAGAGLWIWHRIRGQLPRRARL